MLTPMGVSMGGSKEVLRFEFKVLSLAARRICYIIRSQSLNSVDLFVFDSYSFTIFKIVYYVNQSVFYL